MKILDEFREFAVKGNVVDLAIGVVIGAAFGRIVESLVGDMIMPIFGAIGGLDFSNYFLALSKDVTASNLADAKKQGAVIAWGNSNVEDGDLNPLVRHPKGQLLVLVDEDVGVAGRAVGPTLVARNFRIVAISDDGVLVGCDEAAQEEARCL
jgi:hypothetical protein